MNEIYWITRLDAINTVCLILFSIALTAFCISGCIYLINRTFDDDEDKETTSNITKKICFISAPIIVLFTIFLIFVPTTKEAYQIYGIGGTIDYLKSNKEAKKIPDKAIKALNFFLDNECKQDTTKSE